MRFNLTCVYWTLLFISIISSGLLFIIVASEGIKASKDAATKLDDREHFRAAINISGETNGEKHSDPSVSFPSETKTWQRKGATKNDELEKKTERETLEQENEGTPHLSLEITAAEKPSEKYLPELDIFADFSTQQPNLSQGLVIKQNSATMTKRDDLSSSCLTTWPDDSPAQLLRAAVLYLGIVTVLWCFPTRLNSRIPESDQAAILTLVDTAAAELQSLAEPRLTLDSRGSKSVMGNLSLSMSSSTGVVAAHSEAVKRGFESTRNFSVDEESSSSSSSSIVAKGKEKAEDKSDGQGKENLDVLVVRADQTGSARGYAGGIPSPEEITSPPPPPTTREGIDSPTEILPTEYEAGVRLSGATSADVLVPQPGTDPQEDIPSFSEWAQKRLEEAEKKKSHPNASSQNPGGPGGRGAGSTKVRSKNYASPDCGAKIVAANPEAGSASSVLSSSRDEYMLNTCTSRVWFVVELCEAIQAEKIELANFELFSSSPRDFSVFVGDRFPSRDWSAVGQFAARDERDIQSFALDPRLFGKFVKVELHSHYGSEHFCPVSLFRVYGTSEFEVLETENQIQESLDGSDDDNDDDDGEEMLDVDDGADPPRNLFGSARDAVLSIVKKAAEVLVKSGDAANDANETRRDSMKNLLGDSLAETCVTPRFSLLCDECTEPTSTEALGLLSCRDRLLSALLRSDFINGTLSRGNACASLGVRASETKATASRNYPAVRFLATLFPLGHLVALCNVFAARENRAVVDPSFYVTGNNSEAAAAVEGASIASPHGVDAGYESRPTAATQQRVYCTSNANAADSATAFKTPSLAPFDRPKSSEEPSTVLSNNDATVASEVVASLIEPTRTLESDEGSRKETQPLPILEPSRRPLDESASFDPPTTASPIPTRRASTIDKVFQDPGTQGTSSESLPQVATAVSTSDAVPESGDILSGDRDTAETIMSEAEAEADVDRDPEGRISPQDQLSLDTLLSDLKDLEVDAAATLQNNPATPSTTFSQPQPTPQQKESVFLRLSNRIKTLERNMSLSGQYLEELSKRYKKQVEEMQRSLERAITAMGEESRRGEEREARRVEEVSDLREQVSTLSRTIGALLNDRDSWGSKFSLIGQHVVLVCVEIVVVLMVLSYCRRSGDPEDDEVTEMETGVEPKRRKSVETPTSSKKLTKKRRPSEIAARISGTSYRELLIDENVTAKRGDKKRKRKRDNAVTISNSRTVKAIPRECFGAIPGGTELPSRRASSSEAANHHESNNRGGDVHRRPVSAPETSDGWFSDQKACLKRDLDDSETAKDGLAIGEEISRVHRSHGIEDIEKSKSSTEPGKQVVGGILKNKRLSSPPFMKTALVTRSKRIPSVGVGVAESPGALLKSDHWEWYSRNSGSRSSQENIVRESPTSTPTPTPTPSTLQKSTTTTTAQNINGFPSRNGRRYEDSDDSGSRSTTPSSVSMKEKKSYGLKKIVKKLF